MQIEPIRNIEVIRPLLDEWSNEADGEQFGVMADPDYAMAEMTKWIEQPGSDVLVAIHEEPVGFLALFIAPSSVGAQTIAVEKYWYVHPRASCGVQLLDAAQVWAKDQGCRHLMMSASKLAGNMYAKVCRFYERRGFELVESSFIKEV
jgi:GNAT superfamily N-acetyltransferase